MRLQQLSAILGNKGNQRLQCNKKMTTSIFCKINQFAISAGLCNNLAGTWKNKFYFGSEVKVNSTAEKNSKIYKNMPKLCNCLSYNQIENKNKK